MRYASPGSAGRTVTFCPRPSFRRLTLRPFARTLSSTPMILACILLAIAGNSVGSPPSEPLFPAYTNISGARLYGYIDREGAFRIPPRYRSASWFSDGLAFVQVDNHFEIIDEAGRIRGKTQETPWGNFHHGMAAFLRKNGDDQYLGFISVTGQVKVQPTFLTFDPTYDQGEGPQEGFLGYELEPRMQELPAWVGDHFSLGTRSSKTNDTEDAVFNLQCQRTWTFPDHYSPTDGGNGWFLVLLQLGGKEWYEFRRPDGSKALPQRFANAEPFSEGFAPFKANERWGYINTAGVIVCQPQFTEAFPFHDGLAQILQTKGSIVTLGYLDKSFHLVHSQSITFPDRSTKSQYMPRDLPVFEGLRPCWVWRKGSWNNSLPTYGYSKPSGEVVIKPEFLMVSRFRNGLAYVYALDGTPEFVNHSGKVVWRGQKGVELGRWGLIK
jgi:hypothetical protein